MPSRETILIEQTHSDIEEVEKRIFYTLTDNVALAQQRNSKIISLLIAKLKADEGWPDDYIDELLFDVVT